MSGAIVNNGAVGIYFGTKAVSVAQSQGKGIFKFLSIPYPPLSKDILDEKITEEDKLVAFVLEDFRKNAVDIKEASLCLSGKDLIVRHFEMPAIPEAELLSAVKFEVKKYLPFKIEELIYDFQWKLDKRVQKNNVLFAGIKKETFKRYEVIMSHLGIKMVSLEYAAFSALRLLKLNNIKERGSVAVVTVDLQEDDEMNFVVLDNGFPLFSRDITFAGGNFEAAGVDKNKHEPILDKLTREMRMSLDYYVRKFPLKNISKICFIAPSNCRADLEALSKQLGLAAHFIDLSRYAQDKSDNIPLNLLKACGSSLSKTVKLEAKVDLLKTNRGGKTGGVPRVSLGKDVLLFGLKLNVGVLGIAALLCGLVFFIGIYRISPLQKRLKDTTASIPQTAAVEGASDYETIKNIAAKYRQKIGFADNLMKTNVSLTTLLDALPRVMPDGCWLEDFLFIRGENNIALTLIGTAYLGDNAKELELVNRFLGDLKKDKVFTKYFNEINLVSFNSTQVDQDTATRFELSCKSR